MSNEKLCKIIWKSMCEIIWKERYKEKIKDALILYKDDDKIKQIDHDIKYIENEIIYSFINYSITWLNEDLNVDFKEIFKLWKNEADNEYNENHNRLEEIIENFGLSDDEIVLKSIII
jgi:hypothetical protein